MKPLLGQLQIFLANLGLERFILTTKFVLLHRRLELRVLLVVCELLLTVLVQSDILFGEVRDLFRLEEKAVALSTADRLGVDAFEVFTLVVYKPVDVEVLDGAHDDLNALQRHSILTMFIATSQRPQLS